MNEKYSYKDSLIMSSVILIFSIVLVAIISIIVYWMATVNSINKEAIDELLLSFKPKEAASNLFSYIILTLTSIFTVAIMRRMIRRNKKNNDEGFLMANYAAILVGFIITFLSLEQTILTTFFDDISSNKVTSVLFRIAALLIGFFIWNLRSLRNFGEFVYVLLLTITLGFSWYARIFGTKELLMISVYFITGSIIRIATQEITKNIKKRHAENSG